MTLSFAQSFKFTIENFVHSPCSAVPLFTTPEQTESNTQCRGDVIPNQLQCFQRMEINIVELISSPLESANVPKRWTIANQVLNFRFEQKNRIQSQVLDDVLTLLLAKYNFTNVLLEEYGRRSINSPALQPPTLSPSWTSVSEDIYCTLHSQPRNSLNVQKYNSVSKDYFIYVIGDVGWHAYSIADSSISTLGQ